MTRHCSLSAAMAAGDELSEAELRYDLLAEVFTSTPNLRANLSPALERAKAEILRLRASVEKPVVSEDAKVVAFDPARFTRTGA